MAHQAVGDGKVVFARPLPIGLLVVRNGVMNLRRDPSRREVFAERPGVIRDDDGKVCDVPATRTRAAP